MACEPSRRHLESPALVPGTWRTNRNLRPQKRPISPSRRRAHSVRQRPFSASEPCQLPKVSIQGQLFFLSAWSKDTVGMRPQILVMHFMFWTTKAQ
jgi:hypothetical protein